MNSVRDQIGRKFGPVGYGGDREETGPDPGDSW